VTPSPTSLDAWLAFIETLHPKSIAMGLARIGSVAQRMSIALACPIVTVGGTNGKGSTCAMLAAVYRHAGFRVGLYTSPHLTRFNERIRIDDEDARDDELVAAFEAVESARRASGAQRGDGHEARDDANAASRDTDAVAVDAATPLTYFEFTTLAALWLFAQAKLDVLILEVGLGGRLDAVNILDADVAVVTTIDIDHVDFLGHTREAIGAEKAGIFRRNKQAVCGDLAPPASVLEHAEGIGAPLWLIGREFSYAATQGQWSYRGPRSQLHGLPYPALRGDYQLANAATALAAVDALRERLPVPAAAVRDGLVGVELPGRFQVLPGRPTIVLDVAHNVQAARMLADTLGMSFHPNTFAVFGMLADKDIEGVVGVVRSRIDRWYVGPLPGPRGASTARIIEALRAQGVAQTAVRAYESIGDALRAARSDANETDRIAAFGSFLTVAAALEAAAAR
jgi:dihydrofolate synthase/folylpolyglutamate synthase